MRAARPEVEIETIEVLKEPGRALRDGIWMIPALIVGDARWFTAPPLAAVLAALEAGSKA